MVNQIDVRRALTWGWISLILLHRTAQGALGHLPDPTLAMLFVSGACGSNAWFFASTLAMVVGVDALGLLSGRSVCFSPAYPLLLLALLVAWGAGRTVGKARLPVQFGALFSVAVFGSFLTTGGYYALSGRFAPLSRDVLLARIATYSPDAILTTTAYGAVALFVLRLVLEWSRGATNVPLGR